MERDKRSILVVDSSPSSIFYLAMLLRKFNYGVQKAASAEDALGMIAGSAPAAVITDTALPRMSGVDFLRQVKSSADLSFIPVIMQTAESSPAVRDACMRAGCAGYFFKPVEPESLFQAIQTALETTPRKNIRISAAFKARIGGLSPRFEDVSSLSENGLYLMSSAPEPVNALLPVTFSLNDREIAVAARVLYSSAKAGGLHPVPGMGVKFETIRPEDRGFIREYIRDHVAKSLSN